MNAPAPAVRRALGGVFATCPVGGAAVAQNGPNGATLPAAGSLPQNLTAPASPSAG
jgi:hypothetical protein